MTKKEYEKLTLPNVPGVYRFVGARNETLYIGKATALRDRLRSYFANDLLHARGKHIVDMVTLAKTVRVKKTDSVLDAIILESNLIKKYRPFYNTKEKDDKSWNYIVISREEFPRILILREREMPPDSSEHAHYLYVFGPFTDGTNLKNVLRIMRKIFPFRDACVPLCGKPCFNRQIGLCPGVCTGEAGKREYAERVRDIALFLSGKKSALIRRLKRLMRTHSNALAFEKAGECKREIFSLKHIRDVSLISEDMRIASRKNAQKRRRPFRIEAYDVAHISGKFTVGAMSVILDGRPMPSAYRRFKLRFQAEKNNDVQHVNEVLRRRLGHAEWPSPDIVVIDGGVAQKRKAEKALKEFNCSAFVVSVVKDTRHKPRAILGNTEVALSYERSILLANAESHRFAASYHRQLRSRLP